MAVRKGPYKRHYWFKGSHCLDTFPDKSCHDSFPLTNVTVLYNVERDPGEVVPLSQDTFGEFTNTTFDAVMKELDDLAKSHLSTFKSAASQMSRGSSVNNFPCCITCTPMPSCCHCESTTGDTMAYPNLPVISA